MIAVVNKQVTIKKATVPLALYGHLDKKRAKCYNTYA